MWLCTCVRARSLRWVSATSARANVVCDETRESDAPRPLISSIQSYNFLTTRKKWLFLGAKFNHDFQPNVVAGDYDSAYDYVSWAMDVLGIDERRELNLLMNADDMFGGHTLLNQTLVRWDKRHYWYWLSYFSRITVPFEFRFRPVFFFPLSEMTKEVFLG